MGTAGRGGQQRSHNDIRRPRRPASRDAGDLATYLRRQCPRRVERHSASVEALRRSEGTIINITSVAGSRPGGSSIPYAVSKAALNHLTALLALTLGPEITVNAVAPGLIDTPWTFGLDDARDVVEQTAPLRRIGTAEDVAQVCLAVAQMRYTTGEVFLVDGGMHLR